MEQDMSSTDANAKRRHSDSEDVEKEDMSSTDANAKRRHSDSEDVEKEDMSSTDANAKRRHSDSEDVEKEDMSSTDANAKRRHSDSEDVEKEDMSSTDANAKRRHSDSEDVEKEDMSSTDANAKRRHSDSEDVEKEDMSSTDANPKRRHSDSGDVENDGTTAIKIKKQKKENGEATEECTAAINIKKQKQENGEASEGSQETNRTEMGTQTDVYDFIRSERVLMLGRLASAWTSNVDYHPEISDTWCNLDVTRSTETTSSPHTVYVYNTDGNRAKNSNIILEWFSNQLTGGMLFYHGTDELSAKNIIERGIDLTLSTRCADFSQGNAFYVTKDYGSALEWGERMVQTSGDRAAVVAFKIDSFVLNAVTHLSLTVDNETSKTWWQCVVSHFRRGRKSPDIKLVLEDVKYIEGPMAGNFEPELPAPAEDGRLTQLCICDSALAKTFGSLANILCVVFVRF